MYFVLVILILQSCIHALSQKSFALPYVKATIGQTVHLRCSTVTEKSSLYTICDPFSTYGDESKHCYYKWFKGKNKQSLDLSRFKVSTYKTPGYCPLTKTTSKFVKNEVLPLLPSLDIVYFTCYTSVLTIPSVTESDFGRYSCNFSYHDGQLPYYDGSDHHFAGNDINLVVQNTTTFPNPQTNVLVYNQGATVHKYYFPGNGFGQCLVYGADDITWYVDFHRNKKPLNVSAMKDMDMWQVFNATIRQHQPYDNVVESFIVLKATSPVSSYNLGCSLNNKMIRNNDDVIKINVDDYYFHYHFHGAYVDAAMGATLIAIAIMLAVAIGAAAIRSRSCVSACCV